MKRIADFKVHKLKKNTMNSLRGGIKGTSKGETLLANGCTRVDLDEFDDKDGDGLWDDNESGTFTSITVCPPCDPV
jgi:hypothetical protein